MCGLIPLWRSGTNDSRCCSCVAKNAVACWSGADEVLATGSILPDAYEMAELRAANDMLLQLLQQARTVTSEPVASTSSAPDPTIASVYKHVDIMSLHTVMCH